MSGWIKIHRQMTDWEWYDDQNVFRLFFHCLLKANHKDKQWRGIEIKRGQFYTSLDTLSEETGLANRQIRTCLDKLKSTGEMSSTNMRRGRMVTVVKYDLYQGDVSHNVSDASGSRQASDRLTTATKNDKNDKNENNTCPQSQIVDLYHKALPTLTQVRVMSDKRKSALRSRWREEPDRQNIEWWGKYFNYVSSQGFLVGDGSGWQADFEWLINKNNLIKVIEGKYENR